MPLPGQRSHMELTPHTTKQQKQNTAENSTTVPFKDSKGQSFQTPPAPLKGFMTLCCFAGLHYIMMGRGGRNPAPDPADRRQAALMVT